MADTILETVLKDQCRQLHLPSVSARCMSLEQEAVQDGQRHSQYLSALLEQEFEDRAQRRAQRRVLEARFPQVKRLSDFRFEEAPAISATQIAQLAEGTYIERAENVLLIGDSGTGKTGSLPSRSGPFSSRTCSPPPIQQLEKRQRGATTIMTATPPNLAARPGVEESPPACASRADPLLCPARGP